MVIWGNKEELLSLRDDAAAWFTERGLPLREEEPEQEPSGHREPEPGLPRRVGPQRDDPDGSTDNPRSRSPLPGGGEPTGPGVSSGPTPFPSAEIQPPDGAPEKAGGDAFSGDGVDDGSGGA